AVSMMESNWDSYDKSPNPAKRPTSKGHSKALETHWSMGDEDEQPKRPAKAGGAGAKSGFWDF
ncbi:MAG: hypothetical protein M1823_008457, partial [Watsoniomyces obsoletus]